MPLYGGKPLVLRLDDPKYRTPDVYNDSHLVADLAMELDEATCVLGWNIKMFDIPFINTRLMHSGERPLEKCMCIDMLYYARRPNMVLHSARLESVMDFLKLKSRKSKLDPEIWVRAKELETDAMDYVVKHCVSDTKALKEAWEYLRPFVSTIHR